MVKYTREKFDHFLTDKDLREHILKENPVPKNIDPVKILDHLLEKFVKGRQETLVDKDLETVWSKFRNVLKSHIQVMENH